MTQRQAFQEVPEELIAAFPVVFMSFRSEQRAQFRFGHAHPRQFQDFVHVRFFQLKGNPQFF